MCSTKTEDRSNLKFKVDATVAITVKDALVNRGWTELVKEACHNWDIYWCEPSVAKDVLDSCKYGSHQRVPHFRNNYELTTKNMLYRNIKRHKQYLTRSGKPKETELCDCVPTIFELPAEYRMFIEEYRKSSGATWIVKPSRGSRGKGIFLFQKLKELTAWREQQKNHPDEQNQLWLIQRYVEKPYLIGGRKFDMRVYVLVNSFNPLKAWMARDGFARISGSLYSLDCLQDNLVHLTNTSVQISLNTDPSRQGYKWSLHKLRQFLTARHGMLCIAAIFDRIAWQVMTSLAAVQSVVMHSKHSFELYGYDILFDEELTSWLLEVNSNPTLNPTSLEDYRLKYNMVDDVFHILDFEHRLNGKELRVGGFDLMWNDGPVYKPSMDDVITVKDRELNSYLGFLNDRDKNLKELNILDPIVTKCTHHADA